MGGGTPSNTTTTTKTELPPWLAAAAQRNIASAEELGNRPYQPYTGGMWANLTPQQQAAVGMAEQGSGYQPYIQGAANQLGTATGIATNVANAQAPQTTASLATAGQVAGQDLNPYMNPYTQSVIDKSLQGIDRTRQGALTGNQAAATAAGAFGGSRHGVVDALTNEAALRQSGELAANLNSANFNQAQQALIGDINRSTQNSQFNAGQQQAAGALNANLSSAQLDRALGAANSIGQFGQGYGQLGALQSGLYGADYNRLLGIGNQLQDDTQFALDKQYEAYLRAQQYPIDMLNLRVGATAQTPYGTNQSQTSPLYRNRTAGALGGAASGAAAGATIGSVVPGIGTAVGAVAGGLLGAAGGYYG